ncbi:MAG TPA: tRNA pseudouridine(38-40) synthase TruA [Longimicrobiales bacterium]|nr:tRNA pseudouridine(38-40) synthase TruA [Longimicrobiales bacterium]
MSSETRQRIKLTLHYDGSGFHGWQVQPGVRTVQAEVEAVLSRLADRPVRVTAAGRTDAGVHATGQVVGVEMPAKWTARALRKSLNALLPEDVWAADAESVPPTFHARYDAVARGYRYRVGTGDGSWSPFRRRWCWPMKDPLDASALSETAAALPGEHSFEAFAKAGQPERGYRCTVHGAGWVEGPGYLEFRVIANRFLHHMVRYLVGTMVEAARGRRPAGDLRRMLLEEERGDLETSPPAPPGGLFLSRVYYTTEDLETGLDDEDLS